MNAPGFDMSFSFGGPGRSPVRRDPTSPMVIALVADFSGRASRSQVGSPDEIAARRPLRCDVDNLDAHMERLSVHITLGQGAGADEIRPTELDALHPDELWRTLSVFDAMRTLRKRLTDPATSHEACQEVRAWAGEAAPDTDGAPKPEPASPADDFERLLGAEAPGPSAGAMRPDVDAFVRALVGPHVVESADPDAARLTQVVDQSITEAMRRVLRDPGFRATERAWRSAQHLITTLETDETSLRVLLVDISAHELEADLRAHADDPARSGIARLLRSIAQQGDPVSMLALDRVFGASAGDAAMCARLGAIAAEAGAALLAGASLALAGCPSLRDAPDPIDWQPGVAGTDEDQAAWGELRSMACATSICLACPRFMLRAPYGPSDPIDAFDFDEVPSLDDHTGYLWAPGSLLCAQLLGEAYSSSEGRGFAPGAGEVGSLPMHSVREMGESAMKPCAEAWLTDRAADRMADAGLCPCLSIKGRTGVRVASMRSMAVADGRLLGPWG